MIVNNQDAAGRCFQWLRDTLGDGLGYDELTACGVVVGAWFEQGALPPWLNGERSPIDDRKARGGFHNLSLATTKADMVRSVLEAWPSTAGGCCSTPRSSPSAGSTTSGSSAAARRPTAGPRSWPTSWIAPSSGSTSRCTPASGARRSTPASRSGRCASSRCGGLVKVDRGVPARPR